MNSEDGNAEYKKALNKALVLIRYNDRTCREIKTRLLESGFSDNTADKVVVYLKEQHFLDDRRYAEYYVECYSSRRSLARMRRELSDKGIEDCIIADVLNEADETTALEKALKKQLVKRKLSDISEADYADKRKISEALYRQGYSYDKIRRLTDS